MLWRALIERELESRADQRVLRWFGHVEILDDYRMARRVLMAEVRLNEWHEGGLGQQRNDCEGRAKDKK